MLIIETNGVPIGVHLEAANRHEVTQVQDTLASLFTDAMPERLIGDKAYDSDALDADLAAHHIAMIASHRRNRKRKTQDGRTLRRARRRWKVERTVAWLQSFRRLVERYEYYSNNFLVFVQLACVLILLQEGF